MGNDTMTSIVIPLLMVGGVGYYAFRVVVMKDISIIQARTGRKLKDKDMYLKQGGRLLLMLLAVTVLMMILMHVNQYAGLAVMVVGAIVFGILWRRMYDKYGEE